MTFDEEALADRLYADAIAAPLRVPDAFFRSKIEVTRGEVEKYARRRATDYRQDLSATEADAERALENALKRWQPDIHPVNLRLPDARGNGPWRSVTLLARAARKLLQPDGREMILRVDRNEPGREILRWRFVSLALPPGILIAAATPAGFTSPKEVRLLHSSIAPDHPVAHNHVHHAAMMSFEELWASLRLRALLRPGELEASLRNQRAFCPGLHRGVCLRGKSDG